jgi:2-polyprenyl-3-methyl-5-hydroxy-6-metoxy-1,4-benzoquinol methylase
VTPTRAALRDRCVADMLCLWTSAVSLSASTGTAQRQWSRASAGETAPQRTARLQGHREHQARQKARRLAELDELLIRADAALGAEYSMLAPPCGALEVDWASLQPGVDPCSVNVKMAANTQRGQRKRESILAIAWLLETELLPQVTGTSTSPTIVDCGCGTGSLLLPLAAIFPHATFVGVDYKRGSIERLSRRAEEAGEEIQRRVVPFQGRIEAYDGPCDVVLALHACGEASDAALQLASLRDVPFAVSPCCVGKIRRGPASQWLSALLSEQAAEATAKANVEALEDEEPTPDAVSSGEASAASSRIFALLASWADSEHVLTAPLAPSIARRGVAADGLDSTSPRRGFTGSSSSTSEAAAAAHLEAATRRQRCKTLVELDRLFAMSERAPGGGGSGSGSGVAAEAASPAAGRLLRIAGEAMATSSQCEVLTGPAVGLAS